MSMFFLQVKKLFLRNFGNLSGASFTVLIAPCCEI